MRRGGALDALCRSKPAVSLSYLPFTRKQKENTQILMNEAADDESGRKGTLFSPFFVLLQPQPLCGRVHFVPAPPLSFGSPLCVCVASAA